MSGISEAQELSHCLPSDGGFKCHFASTPLLFAKANDTNMRRQEAAVMSRIGRKPRETTVKPRKPITAPVQRKKRKQKIKSDATSKTQNTENTFPCKKCGR